MKSLEYRFSLDLNDAKSKVFCNVRKGDNCSRIIASLRDDGKAYSIEGDNLSVVFAALKPDNNAIYDNCTVSNNSIIFNFNDQTAPVSGSMPCQFILIDGEGQGAKRLSTPVFYLEIENNVDIDEEAIVSSETFTALTDKIAEAQSLINRVEHDLETGAFKGDKGDTGATGPPGPKGLTGSQGPKGDKGDTGEDGFSPMATVAKSGNKVTITIIDKNGTTSESVFDSTNCENVVEVVGDDLDRADRNDTLYIHKVGNRVKGIVFVAGDVPPYQGCTQYRLRKSGSVEYRTGTLNTTTDPYSYDWSYTATGNWKRLATLDDIPDIPEVVNPWKNKTYISHGDSITWQDGRAYGSGTHQGETARGYQTVLKELLELGTHTNKGVNGATLADRAGVSVSGVSTIKSIASYASYDLCTIAFGTNDFKQGVPLGTLGAATDTVFDTTTFFGAFREAVKYILTSSPTIRLVLMTPLQRDQHDYNVDTVNAAGLKLIDYVNAVKLIGKMYGLPVCDLYSNSGITELTLSTYTIDGLHPNDEGYKRMAEVLAETLTTGGNNDTADLSEFSKLAPLNPTAEQVAALPGGQLYSDTANHKGVIKGGQEFYDASKIDSMLLNYVKNSALDSAITDFYIGLINPPVLNSPPPGKAQTGDLYDIGTVIGYALPITFSSTVTIYFVLKDITFGLNRYNYNWQRLGGSHSFKLRTGVPVSTLNYDDTFTPPLKVGDTAVQDPYNPPAKRTYYVLENVITSATEMTFVWTEVPIHKTTLSGYGITNAYTKTEINQKGYLTLETLPIYDGTVI